MRAAATFKTEQGTRYLSSLCHHFGRKVQTTCNANNACILFDFGRCDMRANATEIELIAQAQDKQALDTVVDVMSRHLERFAFRENPHLEWSPA
ncbi:MAG: DUF2218 domain-containing protein [Pseudomonadota bacterium]